MQRVRLGDGAGARPDRACRPRTSRPSTGAAARLTTRSSVRLGNCERNSTRPRFDGVGELRRLVIGEIQERRRRGKLLALEEHRRGRPEQQPRRHRAVNRRRGQLVQPLAEGGIGHLIVVLEIGHEGGRRQVERRRAAALASATSTTALDTGSRSGSTRPAPAACRGSRDSRPRGGRSAPPSPHDAHRRSTARSTP